MSPLQGCPGPVELRVHPALGWLARLASGREFVAPEAQARALTHALALHCSILLNAVECGASVVYNN